MFSGYPNELESRLHVYPNVEELSLTGVVNMQKPVCVKMPRDYHVIIVIVVLQWASLLDDIRVYDFVINPILNARSRYKSLHSS